MKKKVAIIAPNPVNGMGLFEYLETFFENKIAYSTFAIYSSNEIKTNSGISIHLDGTISDLLNKTNEYDALLFACGDAIPTLNDNIGETYWQEAFQVIKSFNDAGKLLIGHCGASLIFEIAGVTEGKKLALHYLARPAIKNGIATEEEIYVDQNILSAECEHAIRKLIPEILKRLQD